MKTPDDQLRSLWRKAIEMASLYARIEEQPIAFGDGLQVTPREIHTIHLIGSRKRVNVTDVGRHFYVSKSAASQMVTKLVKKGYVRKVHAVDSNKEYVLDLTEKGLEAFKVHARFHKKHMTVFRAKMSAFSEAQIEQVEAVLGIVRSVIQDQLSNNTTEK